MAQQIINNLLNFEISPKEILEWVITENIDDARWKQYAEKSNRAEFVSYFLSYLKNQFTSLPQIPNNPDQSPVKEKCYDQKIIEETDIKDRSIKQMNTSHGSPLHIQSKLSLSTPNVLTVKTEHKNIITNNKNALSTAILKTDHCHSESLESTNCNNSSFSKTLGTKTSTPLIKKRVSVTPSGSDSYFSANVKEISPNHSSSSQIKTSNTSFSIEHVNRDIDLSCSSRMSSNMNNSYSSVMKDQPKTSFSSNYSVDMEMLNSNTPYQSKGSIRDEEQFFNTSPFPHENYSSPISPIYSQNMSIISSKNSWRTQNRSLSNNSSPSYNVQEHSASSAQKGGKRTPRQSLSLADFMTRDKCSPNKSNTKKNNFKSHLLRHSEEENGKKFTMNNETFPQIKKNPRERRRIKPTRVDVLEDKGNKKSTTFGTIRRSQTVNPQFSEIVTADKSTETSNYELERGLLRLERQKKPGEHQKAKEEFHDDKRLQNKVPNKIVSCQSSNQAVIPSVNLVENIEKLDVLIHLYCAFLDHNIVNNPMSELYFVIYLITLQYTRHSTASVSTIRTIKNDFEELKVHNLDTKINVNKSLNFSSESSKNLNSSNCDESVTEKSTQNLKNDDNSICVEKLIDLKFDALKGDLGCADLKDIEYNDKYIEESDSEPEDEKTQSKNLLDQTTCEEEVVGYFHSPHNCIYFASCVLDQQRELLKFLDRATLKLLSENSYIASFKPNLCLYLNTTYNMKLEESQRAKQTYIVRLQETNVCFQVDTDNRENFPSLEAFRIFRKQRDAFYEILRNWEENHLVRGWAFSNALTNKIRNMLTMHNDVMNYYHFVRLFKSQLLASCVYNEGQQDEAIDDENLSLLKTLKHLNPEKLIQLKQRLVKPLTPTGPVPTPSFPGKQQFFKDFILCAWNPMFYTYLENCLVNEILELNNSQFLNSEIEDKETAVDECTRQYFITCVSSLKLLAKMLGLLVSLPYKTESGMLDVVISSQIALRCRVMPPLNLQECLENAIKYGKLSLTLPWAVEYLAMMDAATLRLPYYTKILEYLYYIYRVSGSVNVMKSENFMTEQTSVLIRFSLGWLFELPTFPKHLYFNWQLNYTNQKLKVLYQLSENNSLSKILDSTDTRENVFLDRLDIINERALYLCCSFLSELKILLLSGNSNLNNANSSRHITPVSSELQKPVGSTKQVEIQLEEAFFHGQPASIRKTVDFISERVASSCIKYICHKFVAEGREEILESIRQIIEDKFKNDCLENQKPIKNLIDDDLNILSSKMLEKMKIKCKDTISTTCKTRIFNSIEALLPEDTAKSVKEMCVKIAYRIAMERIHQWIKSRALDKELFTKNIDLELSKVIKNTTIAEERKVKHNPDVPSPTIVLAEIRELIWDLLEQKGKNLTHECVTDILQKFKQCLFEREDLMPLPAKILFGLSVDFSLFLMIYRMDLFNDQIEELLIDIWGDSCFKPLESDSPMSGILSPRNVILLQQSQQSNVWLRFGRFLKKLLKKSILSIDALSDQSVALFRYEWDTLVLQKLHSTLTEGISDLKCSDEETERIRLLLNWVASTYCDIDFLD